MKTISIKDLHDETGRLTFQPGSLAITPAGNIVVAERTGRALVEIRMQPEVTTTYLFDDAAGLGTFPLERLCSIAAYNTEFLLAAGAQDLVFSGYPLSIPQLSVFARLATLSKSFNASAIATDASGNVLLCDQPPRRILRIPASDLEGAIASAALTGGQ